MTRNRNKGWGYCDVRLASAATDRSSETAKAVLSCRDRACEVFVPVSSFYLGDVVLGQSNARSSGKKRISQETAANVLGRKGQSETVSVDKSLEGQWSNGPALAEMGPRPPCQVISGESHAWERL